MCHDEEPNNSDLVQVEMLPGSYSFAVTYNGTREQKRGTIGAPNANLPASDNVQGVYFGTELVRVSLQPIGGGDLLDLSGADGEGGSASYYAAGWHAITDLDANDHRVVQAEMLPGTYSFAAVYDGARDQEKATVVAPNPNLPASANVQRVWLHVAI